MSLIATIGDRLRASVIQSMQESLRRREASGRDFLKHITTEHLDDWTVYANLPQVMLIGEEKRSLYIRALPIEQLDRFNFLFGSLLIEYGRFFDGLNWLTSDEAITTAAVATTAEKLTMIFSNHPECLQAIDKLCRSCLFPTYANRKWRRRSWRRYWKGTVGVDEILMIFFALWCLNYEAQKKTVLFLLRKVGLLRSGTPLPQSLQRVSGLQGKSVKPLYPNSPFSSDGTQKTTTSNLPKVAEG